MDRLIDKRIILTIMVTVFVATAFWFGSRIPNLNEKAVMGGDAEIEALGFDTVFEITEDTPFVERVLYTTVNWLDTNKRGMTFGVVLAACLMTLLSLIQRKSFKSSFGNAFLGTLIGTPLGVCVNCAAPIAKGLHAGGTRLETTLAAMISSPTMNMIVLTMLFALFPWYMVLTKLTLTLLFILIGIPVLARVLFTREQLETLGVLGQDRQVCELPMKPALMPSSTAANGKDLSDSIVWFVQSLAQNLWYIIRTTVPLMFLAGFLGSLLIVVIPWDAMVTFLPDRAGPLLILAIMGGIALVGTFLPVPIAFDVVIVAVLLAAGMPVKYAMVLLFTLGIFSIYSFHIVWRYISRPVATLLFLGVMATGVFAGVCAHYISLWDEGRQRQAIYEVFFNAAGPAERLVYEVPAGEDDVALVTDLARKSIRYEPVPDAGLSGLEIRRIPFQSRTGKPGAVFTRIEGNALGIDELSPFSLLRQLPPRYWGRGIATGDVHNDGWPDVLIAADNLTIGGISLYANRQGNGFVKQRVDIPLLGDLDVVNASLVDINNDGWLDIFITAYRGGNHIIYNREGRFTRENVVSLPDNGAVLTAAVSFGDLDADGDLDIVLGNWSMGYLRGIVPGEPASAKNMVLIQEGGEFRPRVLDKYPGETLSTLLTDLNNDGRLDLIVGNDFDGSDVYYYGDGAGGFSEITADKGIVPHSTDSTMSIASVDIDNDLVPEVYLAQIAKGEGANFAEKMVSSDRICDDISDKDTLRYCANHMTLSADIDKSQKTRDAMRCLAIDDALLREDCVALHVLWSAWRLKDITFCEMVPAHLEEIAVICLDMFGKRIKASGADAKNTIPQIKNLNVLLASDGGNGYVDLAVELGLNITGWAWNSKFADVDNDEWQDLYVANGRFPSDRRESNFFFSNQGGKIFQERTADYGLTDYRATGSYSYIDLDGDGDLDIISVPVNGPVRIFLNNSVSGNSIIFELRDEAGNRFGIGSKIIIRYGPDGSRQQLREIQAGGGFISFDSPVAHFGIGTHDRVEEVEIQWSTGTTMHLKGPFDAGARYLVKRTGAN